MWFVYLCFIVCMLWALIYQPYILPIFVGSFTGTGAIIYDYPGISKLTVNDIGKVARYLNTTKQNSLDCVNDTKKVQCKEEVISISLSLTHWGRDQIDAISQTTFSNAFSRMQINEFRLEFHWSLFLMFELTIFQHWFI